MNNATGFQNSVLQEADDGIDQLLGGAKPGTNPLVDQVVNASRNDWAGAGKMNASSLAMAMQSVPALSVITDGKQTYSPAAIAAGNKAIGMA